MGDVENIIERVRGVGQNLQDVLDRDGSTFDDVKEAATGIDDIESEIERLLDDG